jgi:tRNA pseudouridine55 synthase
MVGKKHTGRDLNGILLLDKPVSISSNRALQIATRLFNARKAGHTGSLDPLASGMLPICFGEATKISGFLLNSNKAYTVTALLGVSTDSGDADGEVVGDPVHVDVVRPQLEAAIEHFRGSIDQIPPMFSALKHQGQRLYKLARKGIVVERKPRQVTIQRIELLSFKNDHFSLYIECSKGTYIRSLVVDIGAALGCGAHVTRLHRNWVQPFAEQTTYSLEHLESLCSGDAGAIDKLLLATDAALELPAVVLDSRQTRALLMGQVVDADSVDRIDCLYAVYADDNRFLGIGICKYSGKLTPKRLLRTDFDIGQGPAQPGLSQGRGV